MGKPFTPSMLGPGVSLAVTVNGGDYTYKGWLVSAFVKRGSMVWRVVVQDEHGRLFIHRPQQIRVDEP